MEKYYKWILVLIYAAAIKGQSSWNPSSMLSRVPGLHPVGGSGSIGFPQFLTMRNSYSSGSTHRSACPHVNKDCPKQCRKADSKRCRVCDCSEIKEKAGSCLDPPTSCPKSCRKRDEKGCKICSCNNEHSGSMTLSSLHGSTFKNCYAMLMCMISCKKGYTLGAVTNEHGCQSCKCIDSRGDLESHNNDKNSFNPAAENNNKDSEQSWSYTSISGSNTANYQDNANTWGKDTGNTWTENTSAGNTNKDNWESGSSGQSSGNKNDIWGAKDGVGESSSKCSGPLCPGNSGGINPMFPGASLNSGGSGSSNTGGCQGPFCAGQGGMGGGMGTGMGGAGGSSSSGCSGPFCTMSGMGGGMGGTSGGGMGGMAGGMGGASGGGMGGPGGVGAFSPFGLAAASSNSVGGSSGCSGPFCTMSTGNSADGTESSMTSSKDKDSNEDM